MPCQGSARADPWRSAPSTAFHTRMRLNAAKHKMLAGEPAATLISEPDEAERWAPFWRAATARAACYNPTDLYLEPVDLPQAYVRTAKRLGVSIMEHTPVTAVGTRDGAIERVVTDRGDIRTPVVVDAAGAGRVSSLR